MSGPEPLPEALLLAQTAWLRRLARHMVGEEDADDVVQDACVAALERPPRSAASLRGWLARVVRNAARQRYRDRMRRLRREALAARAEAGPAGDDVVVRAETQQRVVSAVLALDEPYRTTVLLRFFDELPARKVAERTGVPVSTVHTRLRRGLEQLRARLSGRGRSWALVLLPLLPADGRLAGLLAAGGAVMKKKAALAVAAAALAISVGSVVWLSRAPETNRSNSLAAAPPRAGEDGEVPEPGGGATPVAGRIRLSGRVVDADGNAIQGARVDVVSPATDRTGIGTTISRFGPGVLDATRSAAQVTAHRERMLSFPVSRGGAVTDAEGRFDIASDPLPGDYVLVRAPGFAAHAETGLSLLRSASCVEIRLKRQVACRVRVVAAGAPVAGARVSLLSGFVLARAETDAEGRASFEAEPRGDSVLVEHGDYPPAFGWLRDGSEEESEVELRTGRRIEGIVLRASDRAPVSGATVYFDFGPELATTDERGRFAVPRTEHLWSPRPALLVDAGAEGVAAVPLADLPPNPLEIVLRPTLVLEGRLEGAVPLEGLTVFALQPGLPCRAARADGNGHFRIEGAAADEPVRVLFDPWDPLFEEKGPLPHEVKCEPWTGYATFEIVRKGAIVGRVIDESGAPVAGARIEMRPGHRGVDGLGIIPTCAGDEHADEDGRFRIDGVTTRPPPSRAGVIYPPMTLRVSASGYVWRDEGLPALEPGEERAGVVIRLERGLSITGRVVMEDGSPVPRVKVRVGERGAASDDMRHTGSAYPDEEGRYRVDALPAGSYWVGVWAEELQPVWLDGVPAGSDVPPLVLRRGATIEGIVVDEEGHPLARAHVSARRTGATRHAGDRSDVEGRFRIRQLEPGAYDVSAGLAGYLWDKKAGVAAPSSDVRLVLSRGLSIRGRVVGPDGAALPHVNVNAERIRWDPNLPGYGGQGGTDDEGRFEIHGLSEGEFRLTFENRKPDEGVLPPVTGVVAGTEILVRAEAGRFIEGKLVDRDGNAVQQRVQAVPLDADGYAPGTAYCKEDGHFRIGPLKGTRFTLVAGGWGSTSGFAPDVEAGATDVRIVMGRGEALAGRVVDKDGSPAAANVTIIHGRLGHTWQLLTEDGRFRVEGLPPGTYFCNATSRDSVIVYESWRDKTGRGPGGTRVEAGTQDVVLTIR